MYFKVVITGFGTENRTDYWYVYYLFKLFLNFSKIEFHFDQLNDKIKSFISGTRIKILLKVRFSIF